MGLITHYLETALTLVVMFSVLVAAHEYGHYLFARLFNMGVEEFAIGFGKKPIFEWMKKTYEVPLRDGEVPSIEHHGGGLADLEGAGSRPAEDLVVVETPNGKILRETTRFTVRPWPVGGFVRIKGMFPEEDGSETTIAGGFYNKPPLQRLIVLFAGPLFSVLAGICILVPLFMIDGKPVKDFRPKIGRIKQDGPADKAGLKEDDFVTSIDGVPVKSFYDINVKVRDSAGKRLQFSVLRGNQHLNLSVTPELDTEPSPVVDSKLEPTKEVRRQGKLMTNYPFTTTRVGFKQAFTMAISAPVEAVAGILNMFVHPSTIKDSVGGPISITKATSDTVGEGISPILSLAAVLSISVGILNLLPVVPLDGGQMALAFAELFRGGRRLSMQVQNLASVCGLAFMGVLIVSVFFLDITRLFDHNPLTKEAPAKKANK